MLLWISNLGMGAGGTAVAEAATSYGVYSLTMHNVDTINIASTYVLLVYPWTASTDAWQIVGISEINRTASIARCNKAVDLPEINRIG